MTESDRGSAASDSTSIFAGGLFGAVEPETSEEVLGLDGLSSGSALLVVKRGPNAGSRFQLDRDKVTAGRHPESDIFLDDVTVSRRHAEFRRTSEGFEVADIGSLNGTYVNREPIEVSALTNGDEVQIGKFRLVFLSGDQAGWRGVMTFLGLPSGPTMSSGSTLSQLPALTGVQLSRPATQPDMIAPDPQHCVAELT